MSYQYSPDMQAELGRYEAKTAKLLARTSDEQPKAEPTPEPEPKPRRQTKAKTSQPKPLVVPVEADEAIAPTESKPRRQAKPKASKPKQEKAPKQAISAASEVAKTEPAIAPAQPKPVRPDIITLTQQEVVPSPNHTESTTWEAGCILIRWTPESISRTVAAVEGRYFNHAECIVFAYYTEEAADYKWKELRGEIKVPGPCGGSLPQRHKARRAA